MCVTHACSNYNQDSADKWHARERQSCYGGIFIGLRNATSYSGLFMAYFYLGYFRLDFSLLNNITTLTFTQTLWYVVEKYIVIVQEFLLLYKRNQLF